MYCDKHEEEGEFVAGAILHFSMGAGALFVGADFIDPLDGEAGFEELFGQS